LFSIQAILAVQFLLQPGLVLGQRRLVVRLGPLVLVARKLNEQNDVTSLLYRRSGLFALLGSGIRSAALAEPQELPSGWQCTLDGTGHQHTQSPVPSALTGHPRAWGAVFADPDVARQHSSSNPVHGADLLMEWLSVCVNALVM